MAKLTQQQIREAVEKKASAPTAPVVEGQKPTPRSGPPFIPPVEPSARVGSLQQHLEDALRAVTGVVGDSKNRPPAAGDDALGIRGEAPASKDQVTVVNTKPPVKPAEPDEGPTL